MVLTSERGISRLPHPHLPSIKGTPTHMAPEVLLEGKQSKAADMYAFGITLWELFTSSHPYQVCVGP